MTIRICRRIGDLQALVEIAERLTAESEFQRGTRFSAETSDATLSGSTVFGDFTYHHGMTVFRARQLLRGPDGWPVHRPGVGRRLQWERTR
jgi:hypothetical protein